MVSSFVELVSAPHFIRTIIQVAAMEQKQSVPEFGLWVVGPVSSSLITVEDLAGSCDSARTRSCFCFVGREHSVGVGGILNLMENPAKRVLMTSNGDEVSRNIAIHLAKHGCRLVMMGDEASLRSIVDNIRVSVEGAFPVELHVADSEEAFHVAVHKAWTCLGYLDAFINCYTYQGKMQDILHVSEAEFKRITKINLTAPWFLLKAVASMMKDHGSGGSIVFMATIASGERGLYPGADPYSTASAGIHQLVRASAMSLGKHKIRVNMISRGLHLYDEYPASVGIDRAQKLVKDAAPLGQWLDPEKHLYSTVIYLISDGSCFMTGTTVLVDGAQSLMRPRLKSYM